MKVFFPFLIAFVFACNTQEKKADNMPGRTMNQSDVNALSIIENNCYTCHSPATASHDEILAPPLAGIKLRYNAFFSTEEEFIEQMTSMILSPDSDKARMMGAVAQFGVMPPNTLSKEEAEVVARYIYSYELEEPVWFKGHYEEQHGSMSN